MRFRRRKSPSQDSLDLAVSLVEDRLAEHRRLVALHETALEGFTKELAAFATKAHRQNTEVYS